ELFEPAIEIALRGRLSGERTLLPVFEDTDLGAAVNGLQRDSLQALLQLLELALLRYLRRFFGPAQFAQCFHALPTAGGRIKSFQSHPKQCIGRNPADFSPRRRRGKAFRFYVVRTSAC